ncbi:MAG TPA: hypothetical protein VF834_12650 [Streptosporangiaceae bacterium]
MRRSAVPPASRRVRLLLLWYPRQWRDRYADEFAELLAADLAERPRSFRRAANVAATGLRARLAGAGLASHPLDPAAASRASLATLACSVAACGVTGAAMWSQLTIGLQWSVPAIHGITQAADLMSGALLLLVVLAVLTAVPLARAAIRAAVRGQGRPLLLPAVLIASGAAILVVGGRHFQNGWPGTGGHLLTHQGLVPAGVAAFAWATTMWITTYWVHPAALAAFSAGQLTWMVLSPAAAGSLLTGAVLLLRRVDLSPRALRYQTKMTCLAWAGMTVFLSGSLCWLLSAGGGTGSLFHAGAIDQADLAVLAASVVAGTAAARRTMVAGATRAPGR